MNGPPPPPPDGRVLRLLDANANRAREALRVVEDYARFVLNSDEICGQIKALRHELVAVLSGDAIAWRDTPGDVWEPGRFIAEMPWVVAQNFVRDQGFNVEVAES